MPATHTPLAKLALFPAAALITKCPTCYSTHVTVAHFVCIIPGHLAKRFHLQCEACGCQGPRLATLFEAVHAWGSMHKACLAAEASGLI